MLLLRLIGIAFIASVLFQIHWTFASLVGWLLIRQALKQHWGIE